MRSFLLAMRTFAAAMFGVRKRANAREDHSRFRLGHAIAAAVVMVALFAGALLLIVNLITARYP